MSQTNEQSVTPWPNEAPAETLTPSGLVRPGDRVRLRPSGGGDLFDLALDGMAATVEAIERDFEDRCYIVVTVNDDPGRELGKQGKIAHRFYFSPGEVEVLGKGEA